METPPFKICFFRIHNSLGDVIIGSFFVRELKKLFPHAHLTVVASDPSDLLYTHNPHVDELITLPPMRYPTTTDERLRKLRFNLPLGAALLKTLWKIRRAHYDLLITDVLTPTPRNQCFFRLCGAKRTLCIRELPDKTLHRIHTYGAVLKQLGAQQIDFSYEMHLSEQAYALADAFRQKHTLADGFVIVNPQSSVPRKDLTPEQLNTVLNTLHAAQPHPVVLLDYQQKYTAFADRAILCPLQDLQACAVLISHAGAVVTVDTSIVHIADVFHKKMVAFYAADPFAGASVRQIFGSVQPSTHIVQSSGPMSALPQTQIEHTLHAYFAALS